MPNLIPSPTSLPDLASFSDAEDEELLDGAEQGTSREDREPTEVESAPTSPEETFSRWFGRYDATTVSFYGELRVSDEGDVTELCVDGMPLSELLEPEDLPYYRMAFLPDLLGGHAAWQGEELPDGTIREGCLAVRRGEVVELTYGSQVSPGGEMVTPAESIEQSAPLFTDSRPNEEMPEEPAVISLDSVFSQQVGEEKEELEEVAHAV